MWITSENRIRSPFSGCFGRRKPLEGGLRTAAEYFPGVESVHKPVWTNNNSVDNSARRRLPEQKPPCAVDNPRGSLCSQPHESREKSGIWAVQNLLKACPETHSLLRLFLISLSTEFSCGFSARISSILLQAWMTVE